MITPLIAKIIDTQISPSDENNPGKQVKSEIHQKDFEDNEMTKDLSNLENAGSLQNTCQILQKISPLFFLRYLYLYVDPTIETASENAPSSQDQNLFENSSSSQSERMIQQPRHPLACHTCLPLDTIQSISIQSLPSDSIIKSSFERFGHSTSFFHLKISLDSENLPQGDFSSLLLLETPLSSTISCTTSIYSYKDKILETKELKNMYRQSCQPGTGSAFIYRFDFLHDYWTAFLNGFIYLEDKSQVDVAIQSVTMVQIFHAISEDCEKNLPLLCLVYEFSVGDGSISINYVDPNL